MGAWFWSKKGYFVHGAAIVIVFLSPSVQGYLATHAAYAAGGGFVWGALLHWANGK
jgi:hypothetical protein